MSDIDDSVHYALTRPKPRNGRRSGLREQPFNTITAPMRPRHERLIEVKWFPEAHSVYVVITVDGEPEALYSYDYRLRPWLDADNHTNWSVSESTLTEGEQRIVDSFADRFTQRRYCRTPTALQVELGDVSGLSHVLRLKPQD